MTKPSAGEQASKPTKTEARARELAQKLAILLHHYVSAAGNQPWEEGETCPDCLEDVRLEFMPLITAAIADAKLAGELAGRDKVLEALIHICDVQDGEFDPCGCGICEGRPVMGLWDSGVRVSHDSPFVYFTLIDTDTRKIIGQVVSSEGGGKLVFFAYNNYRGRGKSQKIDKLGLFSSLREAKNAVESAKGRGGE